MKEEKQRLEEMTAELATLRLNKVVDPKASSEGYVRLPLLSMGFRRHLYPSLPKGVVFREHQDKSESDHEVQVWLPGGETYRMIQDDDLTWRRVMGPSEDLEGRDLDQIVFQP